MPIRPPPRGAADHGRRPSRDDARCDERRHRDRVGRGDALPFDLCLSAIGPAPDVRLSSRTSASRAATWCSSTTAARGPPEDLGDVPTRRTTPCCECEGRPPSVAGVPGRFRPALALRAADLQRAARRRRRPPLRCCAQDPRAGAAVRSTAGGVDGRRATLGRRAATCSPARPTTAHFVVEMEDDGVAPLRFGDGELGERPAPGSVHRHATASATARAATSARRDRALVHRTSDLANDIARVRNPLPARGGTAPGADARGEADCAARVPLRPDALQRAITAGRLRAPGRAQRGLQRAAARLVWTGSWFEADVAVDPRRPRPTDAASGRARSRSISRPSAASATTSTCEPPRYVPIDLALDVCVAPGVPARPRQGARCSTPSATACCRAAARLLPSRQPDLRRAHLYLSAIVAAAQAVPGVVSVRGHAAAAPAASRRTGRSRPACCRSAPFEIARLDNDPNHPEHGRLEIDVVGGR